MADQPQQDDESFPRDNVSTGAQISTANDVPAILHDGPDGVPQSGHTRRYCPPRRVLLARAPAQQNSGAGTATSVSKERLSLSTREMNDHKDTVNNNDNEEACDTSTGAGTGDDSDREACDTSNDSVGECRLQRRE